MEPGIEVDVGRRLGAFEVDARFTAEAAGVTALFGESGAGKTSVIDMIAGVSRPDRGRISIGGETVFDSAAGIDRPPDRRRAGYVFQDARLFPHMDVRANLRYGLRRTPPGRRPVSFDRVVSVLGVGHLLDRRTRFLSGGERQRVAIGRAVLSGPRLLLMDEPLAALDAERRAEILPLVEHLRDAFAIPIVYVSHRFDEILRLADRLVLMRGGRVAAEGPLGETIGRLDDGAAGAGAAAGTVIEARLAARAGLHGSARLDFAGGAITAPDPGLPIGAPVRVHIRARDVSVALEPPRGISILNMFAGTVEEVGAPAGPYVDLGVRLDGADAPVLRARVTRHSAARLGLRPGLPVTALVKAVALDPTAGLVSPRANEDHGREA